MNSALDLGELQALQLVQDRPAAVLLSDGTAARRMAKALKRKFTGTLGLITLSVKTGKRTRIQAIDLLKTLPQKSTLHVRKALLQSLIEELEEEEP